MPVKIVALDITSDSRVITLDEYNAGRTNFQTHYFLNNCNTQFGGQDMQVAWADFNTAVNNFITQYNVDPNTVALRFVYCYDAAGNDLYLRLQICTMQQSATAANTFNLITTHCAWYTLQNGSVTATQVNSLSDTNYLNYFYYASGTPCTAATEQQLALDVTNTLYAQNVTFPWVTEVLEMYKENGLTGNGYLCFGATSYTTANSGNAPVAYPHGTVMYLRDAQGNPLLDDNTYVSIFHNKGCDMGTLCPQNCNVYILPA